jgi:hypothetical protein
MHITCTIKTLKIEFNGRQIKISHGSCVACSPLTVPPTWQLEWRSIVLAHMWLKKNRTGGQLLFDRMKE